MPAILFPILSYMLYIFHKLKKFTKIQSAFQIICQPCNKELAMTAD